MMIKAAFLLCLVVAVYSLPTNSKSRASQIRKSLFKRSIHPPQSAISKRSQYDTFTKYDLDHNGKLSVLELSYFFYMLGFDVSTADFLANQQMHNADLDIDDELARWEWERDSLKPVDSQYY